MISETTVRDMVLDGFRQSGFSPVSVKVRSFPGETIVVVEVDRDYQAAIELARELDKNIESGFVTVRLVSSATKQQSRKEVIGVHDDRIPGLLELMSARARTSESQPSLRYVADVADTLKLAVSPRHHLIFGRRGVGKTALLLEARRLLEKEGALTLWVNMHPLRELTKDNAFLTVALRVCDLGLGALRGFSTVVFRIKDPYLLAEALNCRKMRGIRRRRLNIKLRPSPLKFLLAGTRICSARNGGFRTETQNCTLVQIWRILGRR